MPNAEMRKAKSTARKEASIVGTRAASVPPLCGGGGGGGGGGGNEASLGISLSRFVVVRAQNADFMQGKIEHIFLIDFYLNPK